MVIGVNWRRISIFCVVTLMMFSTTWAAEWLDEDSLGARARATTVMITQRDGNSLSLRGSGFILHPNYVATNLHVVAGYDQIMVLPYHEGLLGQIRLKILPKSAIHAEVVFPDRSELYSCAAAKENGLEGHRLIKACKPDLAILRIQEPLPNRAAEITSQLPTPDRNLRAFGFPGDSFEIYDEEIGLSSTGGILSERTVSRDQFDFLIEHGAALSPGNSGGPLYDMCGRVIGVNALTTIFGKSWSVYAGILMEKLDSLEIRHTLAEGPCVKPSAEGVSEMERRIDRLETQVRLAPSHRGADESDIDKSRVIDSTLMNIGTIVIAGLMFVLLVRIVIKLSRRPESNTTPSAYIGQTWPESYGMLALVAIFLGLLLLDRAGGEQDGDLPTLEPRSSEPKYRPREDRGSGGQSRMSEPERPIPTVRSLVINNETPEDIVAAQAKLPEMSKWRELEGTPIPAQQPGKLSFAYQDYGDQCSFRIRIVPEESDPYEYETGVDLCTQQILELFYVAPLRVTTVPSDAKLRVDRSDGREGWEWGWDDGPMPPGRTFRFGNYNVEAKKEGWKPEKVVVRHDGEGPDEWPITLCRTGPEADMEHFGFREDNCDECPEMVVVPAGCYLMGKDNKKRVSIGYSFAVGKYEVTYEQWKACVKSTRKKPLDDGRVCKDDRNVGRGRGLDKDENPAFNVSWEDAKIYVGWLKRKTGKEYRLLSESEWEYVARATTDTMYSLREGDTVDDVAICQGCDGKNPRGPKSVRGGNGNPWDLVYVHGNVSEWVEDCWRDGKEAPPYTYDGSAWAGEDCPYRVVRGGSWSQRKEGVRSASRGKWGPKHRSRSTGFRVARSREVGDHWWREDVER